MTRIKNINKELNKDIWNCYWWLDEVNDIEINTSLFSLVRIHRNNSFYDFLLRVCQLIIEHCVLDEQTGAYKFKEFVGSDKAMANLFESFVRNFYKKKQNQFKVYREDIQWDAEPTSGSSKAFLPKMQTDITLESNNKKIIIETKYYVNALTSRFEAEKFNSNNLYQLYSYLRNIEAKKENPLNSNCEGILLYPTVTYSLNESFTIGNHLLSVKTINLNEDWKNIESQLLNICKESFDSTCLNE